MLAESVQSKLYQLFLLRGHARLCSLHLEGDRPSTVRLARSYPGQWSRPVRAVVLLMNVRRRTLSFRADQLQFVWSATMRRPTLFVKDSWSVITQHGCSAESPRQVRAMLQGEEGHVSRPEGLKKFITNICPPGLLGDSYSACRPMSPWSCPMSFPLSHVSCLLILVPAIMATFACNGESLE